MAITPVVSIAICTRNHARSLQPTLESLATVQVPDDLPAELIVVDNGSTDDTPAVVHAAAPLLSNLKAGVRRVESDVAGLSHARNAAIAAFHGDILLFTDDDLRLPVDWIEGMCRPIAVGHAEATAGGVRLAPHLERPWMTPHHRSWLACTEDVKVDQPRLIGANFAFSRRVLSLVPAFDVELGAGRLGFGEESLFGSQLTEAGFRIALRLETEVEHHCDADRLLRENYLSMALKMGRSEAYRTYHWDHEERSSPRLQEARQRIVLDLRRLTRRGEWQGPEGMPFWEMHYVAAGSFYRQWQIEARRPRRYDRRGLTPRVI